MNPQLKNDLESMDRLLQETKSLGLSYLDRIDRIPVSAETPSAEPPSTACTPPLSPEHTPTGTRKLGTQGLGALPVLKEFRERFEPVMVASAGPRYWGFVTGGSTPAAVIGDWLTSVYDQNTQTYKGQGDISAVVELETVGLLLQLFDLPADFLGGFVSGATMSNFTCLAVARQWAGKASGIDISRDGLSASVPVLAATPHSSSVKSLAMLGLGSRNLVRINTLPGGREAIDITALEKALERLDGKPFILISSGGTVNTVDYDDLEAIARLKEKHNFWWHIDAAFGAFAVLSPQYRHLLKGWEQADSITIDAHKWLNVPYENAFFLVKEKHRNLQAETFQNSNAPYLGDPLDNFNYLNFLPENSRRLKALPVWFTLLAYGKDGYRDIVENNIELAQELGRYIGNSRNFELLAPVRLNTVCFTLKENKDQVPAFLENLNRPGKVFMTPTVFRSQAGIRAALVNWRTGRSDVELATGEMERALDATRSGRIR